MPAQAAIDKSSNYLSRFFSLVWMSFVQLVREPSHSRRADAARRSARHVLLLAALGAVAIIALIYALDVREIVAMPPRGAASLWPLRFLTDFGKSAYVLSAIALLLLITALLAAQRRAVSRSLLLGFGTRVQFLFCAVLMPVIASEAIKWMIGRGRPFVGGSANAFNFAPFSGTEAYASFPSSHAVTSFALAFAVAAVWPQARVGMYIYAVVIAITRLVLLAHHPSDVVAGALVGVISAMFVRYWFAARRLGFLIRRDGSIVALPGPSLERLKRVARFA